MNSPRFHSVEDYLASLDPLKAATLRGVIDAILTQFPELEAGLSWNVPQIRRKRKYVFGVNAFRNHLSLAPWSPRVMEDFRERLRPYIVKQNLFQVPVDWDIDRGLLGDLVRARLTELDEVVPETLPKPI